LGKIDKEKEYIGAIKVYMGFIVAFLMGIGAGISKMYLSNDFSLMFYIGIISMILLAIFFVLLVKHLHKKIDDLEDIE
jgi:hypothetical protein